MSTLAMSRPFSKTYGRAVQKVDHAAKIFDDVVLGSGSKPSPMKATPIMQKWGKASFTSTRGSVITETQKSRKRKIDDDKGVPSDDDPFSFDLEDVGPSKIKKGMGYKVPEKSKIDVHATEKTKNSVTTKKVGRKKAQDRKGDSSDETENGSGKPSLPDIPAANKSDFTFVARSPKNFSDSADDRNGSVEKNVLKPTEKKQLLMDRFTNKSSQVKTVIQSSANFENPRLKTSSRCDESKTQTAKKFFVSRSCKTNNSTKDSFESLTKSSNAKPTGDEKCDLWDSDGNWDLETGDPEIIFNSSKRISSESNCVNKQCLTENKKCVTEEKRGLAENEPNVADIQRKSNSRDAKKNALNLSEDVFKPAKQLGQSKSSKVKETALKQASPSKDDMKASNKAPLVKRLLTNSKKNQSRSKASYNHRQWQNSDDEEIPGSGGSQTSALESKKTNTDDMKFESSDEEPVKPPAVYRPMRVQALRQAEQPVSGVKAGVKVAKNDKPLFMVVRNVKRAHECQEYGESQEFTDDIEYIMDGLQDGQNVSTRCLSAISLVNKCASHAFRMHLRAHGILGKIFSALHNASKYPTLALCTAAIMYMMSRDRLTLELDEPSLELMLQILSSETPTNDMDSQQWKDYEGIQQKIHSVFDGFHQNGKVQHTEFLVSDITAGHLAMEALLRLTSRRDGDWFKDELRTLGGLDHIVNAVCSTVESIDEAMLELTDQAVDALTKTDRCFRVLENVTYLKPENQNYLINYNSSALIQSLSSCLKVCETCLPFNELSTKGEKVNKESPGYIIYSCLLATMRVLVNLTHDNEVASAKIGQQDNLIKTVLICVLRLPRYLPTAERFDVLVLGLGLLVNLTEHSRNNLRILLNTPTVAPFDQYPSISGTLNSLEALGMLFSLRFEAAKMIEEEHDAELEEKERQRQEVASKCIMGSQLDTNESGMWQESDSGIQWIAVTKESRDSVSGLSDDASSIGDFQLMGGGAANSSQGENETFTKALHKAGRHMEDSIVAAYVALVVGCVIQHNLDLAEKVRDTLPDCSFDPMIRMLRKFLGFMNLTTSSAVNSSKSILRVLEVLESC